MEVPTSTVSPYSDLSPADEYKTSNSNIYQPPICACRQSCLSALAWIGSGNSAALNRVFDNLLKGDFTGFKFTASNSVKDLSYIQDLLKDFPEAEKVAEVNKNYFQKAVDDGYGENFISELINKK